MTKYYSRSKKEFIDIANMTDQHVRNAFVQMCKHEPAEDIMFAQQQSERADRLERHKKDLRQSLDDALADVASLTKECDQHIWVNDELKKDNNLFKETCKRVKEDNITLKEENDSLRFDLKQTRNRMMLYSQMVNDKCPNGHAYVFSEIPNDDEGREFVQKMKDYLNKESYKIRVKGQYLDEETKRTDGWKPYQYGQPISKSKCLRVYVDVKKDDKSGDTN